MTSVMPPDSSRARLLRSYIERVENLEEEKRAITEATKEIYAEAKSAGLDPKIMRQVVRCRKLDPHERQEQEALLDTYLHALGMAADTPLGQAAAAREAAE